MGKYIVNLLIKEMSKRSINISGSNVLIMGYTFKENCPDTRNTRVIDICDDLIESGANIDIYDPWVDNKSSYNFFVDKPKLKTYDAIIIAVAHNSFKEMSISEYRSFCKNSDAIFCDLKHVLDKNDSTIRL